MKKPIISYEMVKAIALIALGFAFINGITLMWVCNWVRSMLVLE